MDWKTFRALETFAILFDIQIDEEEYNEGACYFADSNGHRIRGEKLLQIHDLANPDTRRPWERKVILPLPLLGRGSGPAEEANTSNGKPPNPGAVVSAIGTIDVHGETLKTRLPCWDPAKADFKKDALPKWDKIGQEWQCLLAAKFVRGALMALGTTAADKAMDLVGEELGRHLPELPEFIALGEGAAEVANQVGAAVLHPRDKDVPPDVPPCVAQGILRVLYLLEMSACYNDWRSMAHARGALSLLTSLLQVLGLSGRDSEGQSPYELVALFNIGIGQMHTAEYERAAKSFKDVAVFSGVCEPPKSGPFQPTHYFESVQPDAASCSKASSAEAWVAFFRWPCQSGLFHHYIGHQAILMASEALNKQQRSHEALKCIRELSPKTLTPYKSVRRSLLESEFASDSGSADSGVPSEPGLPENNSYPRRKRLERKTDARRAESAPWNECRVTTLESRAKDVCEDRSEFDQVLLEWAKGWNDIPGALKCGDKEGSTDSLLDSARKYVLLDLPSEARWTVSSGRAVKTFVDAVADLIEDTGYREHREETRASALDGLWQTYWWARHRGSGRAEKLAKRAREAALRLSQAVVCAREDPSARESTPLHMSHRAERRAQIASGKHLPLPDGENGTETSLRKLREFLASCMTGEWHDEKVPNGGSGNQQGTLNNLVASCRDCERAPSSTAGAAAVDGPCRNLEPFVSPDSPLEYRKTLEGGERRQICHYWDTVIQNNFRAINAHLKEGRPPQTESGWGFVVLQRWNSFTPAMGATEGGGYLLTRLSSGESSSGQPSIVSAEFGLAIDPGYGFLRNLLAEGYSIRHLTSVAVTHDHPDHVADFDALINLLNEYQKICDSGSSKPKIDVLLNKGALSHLGPSLESSRRVLRDTVVLSAAEEPGGVSEYQFPPQGPSVRVVPAIHEDLSNYRPSTHDSIGLVLEVTCKGETASIGIPSDTAWCGKIAAQYRKCDIVCLHIGSVTKRGGRCLDLLNPNELDDVLESAMHLYLPGVFWFLDSLSTTATEGSAASCCAHGRLVILTETGEELRGGIRLEIARSLDRWFSRRGKIKVVPGDVGLLVDPIFRSMRCSCCGQFYRWDTDFKCECFGDSEQIFYVCPGCRSALSYNQRATIYRRKQTPLIQRLQSQV
jgi:hypothetical protein